MTSHWHEVVGPLHETVEVGSRVWVRHDNKTWDGELLGPGPYEYEVRVRLANSTELAVHRYNVQPQKEDT